MAAGGWAYINMKITAFRMVEVSGRTGSLSALRAAPARLPEQFIYTVSTFCHLSVSLLIL